MTLTRLLLASTAISLGGLGISHAAPLSQTRILNTPKPVLSQSLVRVQLSVGDAAAALTAAQTRKAEVEAAGGDVAAAQAEVDAAQAELAAAQAAAESAPPPPEPEVEAPEAEAPAAPEAAAPETQAAPEAAPAEDAAPAEPAATEAPAPEPEPAPAQEPAAEAAPAPEAVEEAPAVEEPAEAPAVETPSEPAPVEEPADAPAVEAPPAPAPAEEAAPEAPAEAPAADAAPTDAGQPAAETAPVPATEPTPEAGGTTQDAAPATQDEAPATEAESAPEAAAPAPAEPEAAPAAKTTPDDLATEAEASQPDAAAPAPAAEEVLNLPVEDGAPVLDSAKEEPARGDRQRSAAPQSSEPAPPAPTSDQEAQAPEARSAPAPQAMSERGERLREQPAREAQTDVTIINQIDNRTIIEVDNRTIIEHDERDRLRAGSEEVYYEQLRGGRVREVIVRPNGVQLVTITNRWGDVVQRSRVMPDGREYVLFFANANSDGSREAFVDPGRELPPLRLSIPIDEYILDSTEAEPSTYLDFLMEPPVEQVERLYSVEEVRRSARVRDKVRRIDLDSLTFEFGKATIAEDQIQRLSDVADAMSSILETNPAETFLIEGHTDAVGKDEANLLLSDRRAETIAVALSDVFGIPPENLVTQGYGERYLKVRTEAPERLNRRVTIRRITPLVTPVASR
ncbi:OmpA family protein [Hoeflea ulvae]|uniref:OmpA family protein n=1 Tax=Hoeflea ulvae TaxID=2983764 RepID=A0ABT3YFQ4_9HYPH|nr:OmpA family protein [Hoeflea ulvae]MCY0094686.1 OmpA family protein [Hoeflea ulvae]